MNKKFLSVILFSALMVGTAGTFTSCKDYDDDIEGLENRVSAVETLVGQIQEKINDGSILEDVVQTDEGIVIKLSNGKSYSIKNGTKGNSPVIKIGDNGNWFIDDEDTGKPSRGEQGPAGGSGTSASTIYYTPGTSGAEEGFWVKVTVATDGTTKREITKDKWLPEGTLTAVWNTEDQTLTLGNMKDDNGKLVSKTISLSTELKSLVFIPDLYEDGVEATKYEYAPGNYFAGVKAGLNGKDDHEVTYKIKENTSPTSWVMNDKGGYWLPSTGVMYYHMNPLNAKLENIDWKFLGATPEYVTTKAAPAVVTPIFQSAAKTKDGDKMYATYKLSVEDLKGNLEYPGKNKEAGKDYISIAALQGTLAKGEKEGEEKSTVTSDYAAIMPVVQKFAAIAYINYTTEEADCKEELYKTAKDAIEKKHTIDVQYNGGSIKLADELNIHYTENYLTEKTKKLAEAHKKMSIADVAAKYNLTLKFEAVHYISGKNDTEENAYSKLLEDGTFTPCYVDQSGTTVEIPKGSTTETELTGRSAIGRRPVVLVKLVDAANNVVLAGYIKLEITEKSATPDAIVIDKSTPQMPYLCGNQEQAITWKDMSGKVLEELSLTKEEFTANYKFEKDETYVTDGKGGFIKVEKPVVNAYGIITETPDDNTSTNAILTWATTKDQRDQLIKDYKDRTLTLYGKYVPKSNAGTYAIYVGIKISIAELPTTASYGNKRDAYWYPEGTPLAERTNVRTNVPAPNDNDKEVTEYEKNLDDYFWHLDADKKEVSGIEFTVSKESEPIYGKIWNKKDKGMEIKYSYLFSAKNEDLNIGGKKLFVYKNADKSDIGIKLYWGDSRATAALIATLDKSTHILTYADNAQAKVFLNLFSHNESMPNQQYAIIEISSVYGDCEIELAPSYNFNARFLRPLDIASNDNAKFTDAEAGGSSVRLGDLFTAKDWRDKVVINYNTTSKAYEAVSENGINLYNYYEIKEVVLDLEKATCDINTIGTQMPINSKVIKLSVLDGKDAVVASNKVDIATINNLNSYKLNYKNNEGNTKAFTIMVPIKVTYAWGEVEAMVSIAVAGTIANR